MLQIAVLQAQRTGQHMVTSPADPVLLRAPFGGGLPHHQQSSERGQCGQFGGTDLHRRHGWLSLLVSMYPVSLEMAGRETFSN